MAFADLFRRSDPQLLERAHTAEVMLRQEQETNLLLAEDLTIFQEGLAELELAMDDAGYRRLSAGAHFEFTRDGLSAITNICRLYAVKNPLIRRGLSLRHVYVWGSGLQVSARANGKSGGQDVNAVIQSFWDEPANRAVFTGAQAAEENEKAAGTDGNLLFALFTAPRSGAVKIRSIPWDEIGDVIRNPDDAAEPLFYVRRYNQPDKISVLGDAAMTPKVALHPDVRYRPTRKPSHIDGIEVRWDAPVVHFAVNRLSKTAKFGTPDAYAAIDWARAYKELLEDWARLVKSLSRYAWRTTAKGSKTARAAAAVRQAPALSTVTGEPLHAGATAVTTPDVTLEAIPKSGATIDVEAGRPLAAMVAAALGVPVTMLLGDPGVTGARATAETLDEPMRRMTEARRAQWAELVTTICDYVIDQAALAPEGKLKGRAEMDDYGRRRVVLNGDTERTLDLVWPELAKVDPVQLVEAITKADATGKVPPLVLLRLLLKALNVRDADEIIDAVTDDDGNFIPPEVTAGQAAAQVFRRGQDPAALLGNPEEPDEAEPEEPKPSDG